jgi:hypothetical protein
MDQEVELLTLPPEDAAVSCSPARSMRRPCSRRGMRQWYSNSSPMTKSSFSISPARTAPDPRFNFAQTASPQESGTPHKSKQSSGLWSILIYIKNEMSDLPILLIKSRVEKECGRNEGGTSMLSKTDSIAPPKGSAFDLLEARTDALGNYKGSCSRPTSKRAAPGLRACSRR